MIRLPRMLSRLAFVVGTMVIVPGGSAQDPADGRSAVLVVHSYHVGMPWADAVTQGLVDALDGRADVVITQLDVKRHPPAGREEQILAVVAAKAAMSNPRVVVAIDDFAYQFVLRHRDRIAPGSPVVFGGVNFFPGRPPPGVTGVVETLDLDGTLDLIASLQPEARRLVVVNDASETGAANRRALERALAGRPPIEVVYLGDGSFAETEARLYRLDPREDAVLILTWNLDATGATRSYEDAARRARALCPAPLYGLWSFYFGHGIVGGSLLDGHVHGREVGVLVRRVLDGESPDSISVVDRCRTMLRVDQRELDRFQFPARNLPFGTEVLFATPGLWRQHWPTIVAVAGIIVLQSVTISWLLVLRRLRNHALARLRRSEADLRFTLDRFETAQEQALIGSWDFEELTGRTSWSKQMYQLFGVDPSEPPPRYPDVLGIFHPADCERVAATVRKTAESGVESTIEFRSDPGRGPSRLFRATVQSRVDALTGLRLLSGTLQDITIQAQAEAQARESQERVILALQGADLGIWDWHIPSGEVSFDERCAGMLGYSREEIDSRPRLWASLLHPADAVQVREVIQDYARRRITSHEIEMRLRHRSGSWVWILSKGRVISCDRDGIPQLAAGTHFDITDRKAREEVLRATESKLAQIFRSSPEVICLTRAEDGRFLEINSAFATVFGFGASEVIGRTSLELSIWPSPADRVPVIREIVERGEIRNREITLQSKSGRLIPVLASTTQVTLDGEPCLIWILTDITERKQSEVERARLQEELQHAMKMEAIGRLAGGVAHDFNNLLTVISGNVELIREDLGAEHPEASLLAEVASAAGSAADLTRQLLAFSRRQMIEPRVVNLNELLGNLRNMLTRLIGEDVALQLHTAPDLGSVKVDPGQFDQVVVNLAVNARDAMSGGGLLSIATCNVRLDAAMCGRLPGLSPGEFVMLSVADTGHGMLPEVKERLFEPFFTTKPKGRGTGLGLAMIFGVVKQAGGAIEVESEVDRGTAFRIYLPRVDAPSEKLGTPARADDLPRGNETVLLVEDDARVRTLASSILSRLGYQVLSAGSGEEAVRMAESTQSPLDLLLTDLVMPGLNGRETAERLAGHHPHMAVLYTSGYTEDTIVRQGVMTESIAFISKPYSLKAIATKVRETLDARPRAVQRS